MRRYRAWLSKEWREHRAVLVGIFAAIPVLTALAYWAFGERLRFHTVEVFPAVALSLPFVAIGLDSFSRELRRGTHALILRTPGAFGTAFAAKVTLLIAAAGVALAVEEASRAVLTSWTGLPRKLERVIVGRLEHGEPVYESRLLASEPVNGLPASTVHTLEVLACGVFGTAASAWFARGVGTSLVGVAWLGALVAPLFHRAIYEPWFFLPWAGNFVLLLVGASLLGVFALAASWLRGRRYLHNGPSAIVLGLVVTGAVAGIGHAAAGVAYARWMDFEPESTEFRIAEAYLGGNGRRLFVDVHRGALWSSRGSRAEFGSAKGTPPIPWIVDVSSGAWRPIAEATNEFEIPVYVRRRQLRTVVEPVPWLVVGPSFGYWSNVRERWVDTADGSFRLDAWRRLEATVPLVRESLRALTTVRDSRGRRAWRFRGVVERDGEELAPAKGPGTLLDPFVPIPGGWKSNFADGHFSGWAIVDADTGRRLDVDHLKDLVDFRPISPRYALHSVRVAAPVGEREWRLAVYDLVADRDRPPIPDVPKTAVVDVVARDTVLLALPRGTRPDAPDLAFALWNPVTGERRSIDVPRDERIGSVLPPLPLSDGRFVLEAFLGAARGWGPRAWLLLDPTAAALRVLTPWTDGRHWAIAVDADDTFLVIEDGRRVVRFGPTPEDRTVVFPRLADGK